MFAVLDRHLWNTAAGGSTGNTARCCWPSCAAAPPRWADIATAAHWLRTYDHRSHITRVRNRHCPRCQGNARRRWLKARGREVACRMKISPCRVHSTAETGAARICRTSGSSTTCSSTRAQRLILLEVVVRATRRRDRLLQRAPQLNQGLQFHPARPLRGHCRRRSGFRSFKLDLPLGDPSSCPSACSAVSSAASSSPNRNAFHRGELQFHGSLLFFAQPRAFSAWPVSTVPPRLVCLSPNSSSATLSMCCAIWAPILIASPSPTPGWWLSPMATSLSAGATLATAKTRKRLMTLAIDGNSCDAPLLHLLPSGFGRICNWIPLANRNRCHKVAVFTLGCSADLLQNIQLHGINVNR